MLFGVDGLTGLIFGLLSADALGESRKESVGL